MKVALLGVALCCLALPAVASPPDGERGCADFRCRFGDVPHRSPPLIAEPFESFYKDAVVRPMRPYQHWGEPSRWAASRHQEAAERQPRERYR
ncbi:hypothetical protein [Salinicola avicenniae]|uniref:hypothetical protein n=1 Tax=Salinicola avicenniae TaxID=2916836 RepID=UPI002072F31B|nr:MULTISPECIES: hypothetical protein [unclassified Salinicola]